MGYAASGINYTEKGFMKLTVGVEVINPFAWILILQQNKLEFLDQSAMAVSYAGYAGKMFIKLTPVANVIKLFRS